MRKPGLAAWLVKRNRLDGPPIQSTKPELMQVARLRRRARPVAALRRSGRRAAPRATCPSRRPGRRRAPARAGSSARTGRRRCRRGSRRSRRAEGRSARAGARPSGKHIGELPSQQPPDWKNISGPCSALRRPISASADSVATTLGEGSACIGLEEPERLRVVGDELALRLGVVVEHHLVVLTPHPGAPCSRRRRHAPDRGGSSSSTRGRP